MHYQAKMDNKESSDKKDVKPEPKAQKVKDTIQATLTSEEKQSIRHISQVSMWLDGYDDIFSDFDPRPYSQRSLSDDFLSEAKKVSSGKTGDRLELRFLIPE